MPAGPILTFDKSLLQSLSLDECVWLAQFYSVNMTPVFFMETLADLDKEVKAGRTPEQVVGSLARKTMAMTVDPTAHHRKICTANLLGRQIEARGVPVVEGGRSVTAGGKKGVVFEVPEEAEALNRWQEGRFLEVEREYARKWRADLDGLDLEGTYRKYRGIVERQDKPRDFESVKVLADGFLSERRFAEQALGIALQSFVPTGFWPQILERWKESGQLPLPQFAPYAAHAVNVELFYSLALGADLISKDRQSNKIDMAYLYYLPFCMIFTSSDKLHQQIVPIFMEDLKMNQQFIWGPDMKADLKRLDEHFSRLPEEVKEKGVMAFAIRPPGEGGFIAAVMWDKYLRPMWRHRLEVKPPRSPEEEKALVQQLRDMIESPQATEEIGVNQADFVAMARRVPVQVGKWRIVPPDANSKNEKK